MTTQTLGKAGARRFIIEWSGEYEVADDLVDFEVIFFANSSRIQIAHELNTDDPHPWDTVGTQASVTGPYTEYSCHDDVDTAWHTVNLNYYPPSSDSTAPAITSVNNKLGDPPAITADGLVPVTSTWVASDPDDPVASYEVQVGYEWTDIVSPPSAQVTVELYPGSYYRFRIRGTDMHGNTSPWMEGVPFRLNDFQEEALTYSGSWTQATDQDAWEGGFRYADGAGASASFTFTGRNLAWIGTKGPNFGSADVFVDGNFVKTIDCHSAVRQHRIMLFRYSTLSLDNTTHTVTIVDAATHGHARIDVDGLVSFESFLDRS